MKKLFTLFAAALVMLAAASCEKNEVLPGGNVEGKVITLKASINNGETKTSLGKEEGIYKTFWTPGDAIAVINNGYLFKFVYKGDESVTSAEFIMADEQPQGTVASNFRSSMEIKAFYPFDKAVIEGSTIKYNVPKEQTYVADSFGEGVSPMAAYRAAENAEELEFKNLFGVLKLQLKGEDIAISKIQVFSNKAINGIGQVAISDAPTFDMLSDGDSYNTVELVFSEEVALSTSDVKNFLIVLPSAEEYTFTVVITDTEGEIYCKKTANKNILASDILKMSELNLSEPLNPYVENDVNLGDGVALITESGKVIIWAPVNCGYDTKHKGGLLYQWGRKYGQGYSDDVEETDVVIQTVSDGVSLESGNLLEKSNVFFTISNSYNDVGGWGDWLVLSDRNSMLWNKGTEDIPVKNTECDPCPAGWRVPTHNELVTIWDNASGSISGKYKTVEMSNEDGINGYWAQNNLFFPAYRNRTYKGVCPEVQNHTVNTSSKYWSSSAGDDNPAMSKCLYIDYDKNDANWRRIALEERSRASGYSVRCVKE